ncbi:MAG: zf-HC2 domain-containing protein, partial [Ruminiclostridium sp.]|nr:zf-HC2 domain-containing protein [Ruminiclostridium sp.]
MKISCEIIKDLLPLYNDGVCSNESAELISEHLKECSECTAELERLREEIPLSLLKSEEKEIIGAYRRKVLKNALLFGLCFIVFPLINVFYAGHFYEAGFFKPFLATVLVMLDMVFLPAVIKNDRKAILTVCSVSVPIAMFWVLDLDHFHPETLMIDVIVFLIHFT